MHALALPAIPIMVWWDTLPFAPLLVGNLEGEICMPRPVDAKVSNFAILVHLWGSEFLYPLSESLHPSIFCFPFGLYFICVFGYIGHPLKCNGSFLCHVSSLFYHDFISFFFLQCSASKMHEGYVGGS